MVIIMGKIYIDTIKYMVYAEFEVKGLVEKPDVVGAIFGQTEGLLGDELDLREMQKSGRIGRIEVELETRDGKSFGKIMLPSSLDMVETSVIAAAIESVDRVGPCEAKIKVIKIEDMRSAKRKHLIERAKSLLKTLINDTLPESKEILEMVRDEVKAAGVVEYGPEKLPAGPDLDSYDSIIVVEGRADVVNLLKNDIKNVIALGGASVPKTIVDLSKKKEITLFLDGDRGGDIILKELLEVADIDYVARAPPGREVEELARKEIIKALRNKVPVEQAESQYYGKRRSSRRSVSKRRSVVSSVVRKEEKKVDAGSKSPEVPDTYLNHLKELDGTLRARLLDDKDGLIKELPVRDLIGELNKTDNPPKIVILDGIITQRLLDLSANKGVKMIVGIKEGNITKRNNSVKIYTKQ